MKKLLYLLLLLLSSCSVENNSDLYELNKLTKYDITIITKQSKIVNELNLNELDYIEINDVYNKISHIKLHKNSIKQNWIDKTIKNNHIDYNFYINESINNYFNFTVELNFISYYNNLIYYKSYNNWHNTNSYYKWYVNGFSLDTSKIKNTYDFKIITYLYFKVSNDNDAYYVQIPMYINGTINIIDEHITFNIDI